MANIYFEIVDAKNNSVDLSGEAVVYWYVKSPDNTIHSNDPNIASGTFSGASGLYSGGTTVFRQSQGVYFINYLLTMVGEYRYKFQVSDAPNSLILASSGTIKVIDDGIF